VVVAIDRRFCAAIRTDPVWREVKAVQTGHTHFVPDLPFSWLDDPPAPNRLIGVLWLGKLLYPASFPQDIRAEAGASMLSSTSRSRATRNSTACSPILRREPFTALGRHGSVSL
jgi:hypothetical protein